MPGGGLFQLKAYGQENQFINGNPQMTYFKAVYRRYTNFSMEMIEVALSGNQQLEYDTPIVLKAKIPRYGDMFHKMFFAFNLPDIYSDDITQFQWIKDIGFIIINKIRILIGGQIIQEFDGEYMKLFYDLSETTEHQELLNNMTGNTTDVYDPRLNNEFTYIYPASINNPQGTKNINGRTINQLDETNIFTFQPPSIHGRRLYVPIPFWFTRDIGCSFPFLALEYHDIEIQVLLRPLSELFTYMEYNYNDTSNQNHYDFQTLFEPGVSDIEKIEYPTGQRVKPNIETTTIDFFKQFLTPQNQTTVPDWNDTLSLNFFSLNTQEFLYPSQNNYQINNPLSWELECTIQIMYLHLTKEEVQALAPLTHEYVIDQVQIREEEVQNPKGLNVYRLDYYNPIKEVYMIPQRTDFLETNRWTNYTKREDIRYDNLDFQNNLFHNNWFRVSEGFNQMIFPPLNNFIFYNHFSLYSLLTGFNRLNTINNTTTSTTYNYNIYYTLTSNQIHKFRDRWNYLPLYSIPSINNNNIINQSANFDEFSYIPYENSIIKDVKIRFNKQTREDTKEFIYFNTVEPYMFHTKSTETGVLLYSFSVIPEKYQPSGHCNFQQIDIIEFNINFNEPPLIQNSINQFENANNYAYGYIMRFYMVNLNILRIKNGMSSLVYGN